jgi:hypothetical protein
LIVQVPAELEKLNNGNFEDGLKGWNTDVWGGSAIFDAESASPLAGNKSAHIKVNESSGTAWHIQLRQWLQIKKGFTYRISYQARASKNLTLQTWLQMDHDPFSIYSNNQASLTNQAKTFNHVVKATADDKVYIEFVMGAVGVGEVWIDNVSVVEVNPNGTSTNLEPQTIENNDWLGQNYPNPASVSTCIEFQLASQSPVFISLVNQLGQEVAYFDKQFFPSGKHLIEWNISKFSNGIYFYTIHAGNFIATRKLIVNHSL